MFRNALAGALLCLLAATLSACQRDDAHEKDVGAFYRGKTITIVVGFTPGGVYDVISRLLARHMSKNIPGEPTIVVQNMPGAGSLVAANYVFNVAPKDGTVLGSYADAVLLSPLWRLPGAHFDPRKVHWLGSLAARDSSVILVRSDAPATTMEDAKVKTDILGSAGANGWTSAYPLMLNELLGTKFKVVTGYPGYTETMLAIERGEIHGRAGTGWDTIALEKPEWVSRGFVKPLLQLTLKPIPGLDHVPMAIDLAANETDRRLLSIVLGAQQFAHIYSLAEGVPAERVAALRSALAATARDPVFIAEAKDQLSDAIRFTPAETIEGYVRDSYALPEHIRKRAARYSGGS